ncbi:Lactonase, 7-bladed beta-propeller-domain-containing protein [Bombardia bombarda]|uniref:Lactonase, 7-bladed beta-propeller-domain-containing protein n=1 Tax=Bombardia bombarda TaxID=252184 RepID=A0AA40C8V9_9PEZI|nr:Lactonase, 7-bladed beta-propeller-domain-containing protein [Bombardia bombarda]
MVYRGILATAALGLALPKGSLAESVLLYATSYEGNLTTLSLTGSSLVPIASTKDCGAYPSWLTLVGSTLYCADESWGKPNGTLTSFSVSQDGGLARLDTIDTTAGPVSAVVFGTNGGGLAVPGYEGAGLNTFNITTTADITQLQTEIFKLPHDGVNPQRQDKPHPHQAALDPTGRFLFVPDLGSDLVRIFSIDPRTLKTTSIAPLVALPGSGPRHLTFLKAADGKTFMYLISELANSVTGYNVIYNNNKTLSFTQFYVNNTHGTNAALPAGASAGEITLSPDNKFLIVSSRGENSETVAEFDPPASDPLISFSVCEKTGALKPRQTFPAGGAVPRHFSINKQGTLVAVALQGSARVVVISRDPKTGNLKDIVAHATVAGQPNCIIFKE